MPGNASKEVFAGGPDGAFPDGVVQIGVDVGESFFEPADVLLDVLCHRSRGAIEAVLLSDEYLDELAPAGQESIELSQRLVGDLTHRRAHAFREERDHPCVDLIGLGQYP
jgi:hypothetical protein